MAEGAGRGQVAAAPEVRRLAERLREAREATGLSYAALAGRTAYSKSSWERYLNGRVLPPRDAVQTLAELSGADPARLLALWRLADAVWSGRDASGSGAVSGGDGGTAAGGEAAAGSAVAGGSAAAVRPEDASGPEDAEPAGAPGGERVVAPEPGASRSLVVVALAAALATVVLLGTGAWLWAHLAGDPGTARGSFAEPCRGERCTGLDSEQGETDCWTDAETRAARDVGGRQVELRYSATCRAVWGRVREPGAGDEVWVETRDRRTQAQQVTVPGHALYTLMLGVTVLGGVRACVEGADGSRGCTPWTEG
ncbi:helix-turn-helix domain-containing protein [Streptomyces sp. NPDC060194]|uniref:helix-turn-helix domain-containing protein n=1 Tax=Streptomyces sp. NPDC060194 TaxID=3347069 RepID=UPI00364FC229